MADVGRIEEYTIDGSLIRQINLDVSIIGPLQSIELSTGQFVICHTGAKHRVCIMDTTSLIIHSYGVELIRICSRPIHLGCRCRQQCARS